MRRNALQMASGFLGVVPLQPGESNVAPCLVVHHELLVEHYELRSGLPAVRLQSPLVVKEIDGEAQATGVEFPNVLMQYSRRP